jgi:hypothetical protein
MVPVPRTFPPFEGGFNLGPTLPPSPIAPTQPTPGGGGGGGGGRPTTGGGGGGGGRPTSSFDITAYVTILFDFHPEQIGWVLKEADTDDFQVGVPPSAYPLGKRIIVDPVVLQSGKRYRFTIEDTAGDGLTGGPIPGSYSIVLRDCEGSPTIVSSDADWGFSQTHVFTMPTEC